MPLKNNIKSKKGFTIIEVVLVLAIAGLIFLMVFLALPAMQRSRKDTQRRDQLSDLVAQITQYQANNRNRLPNCESNQGCAVNVKDNDGTISLDESTGVKLDSSSSWAGFYKNYLITDGDVFEDPNGNPYSLQIEPCDADSGKDCVNKAQRYNTAFYGESTSSSTDENGTTTTTTTASGQNYRILIVTGAVCEGEKTVATSGSRKVAVVYKLEGGGTFCQGN